MAFTRPIFFRLVVSSHLVVFCCKTIFVLSKLSTSQRVANTSLSMIFAGISVCMMICVTIKQHNYRRQTLQGNCQQRFSAVEVHQHITTIILGAHTFTYTYYLLFLAFASHQDLSLQKDHILRKISNVSKDWEHVSAFSFFSCLLHAVHYD